MTPYYRQQIRKLDKNCDPATQEGQAAALMLAALKHGCRQTRELARVTGVPLRDAFDIARRLRANRIWRSDGRTHADWANEETGAIAFWCDVAVACGLMNRHRSRCSPQPGGEKP